MKYTPAQVKKAAVAAVTAASEAITLGLIDGTAEKITLCVLAAAGVYGVFAVQNAPVE